MSWQAIIMYMVVAGIGFPAAFRLRNITAAALVVAWAVSELMSAKTGNSLPIITYAVTDPLVIMAIFAKATIREGCSVYPSSKAQVRSLWKSLTICDRLIAGLFVFAAWPTYAAYLSGFNPYYTWILLWYVSIAQFALAGTEVLSGWRKTMRQRSQRTNSSNIIQFAPAYARKSIGAEPIPTSSDTLLPLVGNGDDG